MDRGLVECVPGPGRAVKHRLTEKGDQVRTSGSAVMNQVLAHSFSTLTPAELEEFGTLIRRLLRNR
jgi:DNA-binding MarR family transcriptional regulator